MTNDQNIIFSRGNEKIINNKKIKFFDSELFNSDKSTFFSLGKNAIYAACKAIGLKKGDTVLTPVFDCDSTLSPFNLLGLNLEFYKSNPYTFEVDIDDIEKKITSDVKLLHVINHFGIPQQWDQLLDLRQRTGIPILEDNAFSLFSKYRGRRLGTFGDFSIFSIHTILPIIAGGMLRINSDEYSLNFTQKKAKLFYYPERKKIIGLILSKLGFRSIPDIIKDRILVPKKPLPPIYSDGEGYPEWKLRDEILFEFSCDVIRPMSIIAQHQIMKFSYNDYKISISKIRYYYQFVVDELKGVKGVQVLWKEISHEMVPSCVSILIDTHRDEVLYYLRNKKYGVIAWPTYSGEVLNKINEYPEVDIMGKKILQLMIPVYKVAKKSAESYFKRLVYDLKKINKKYN